jgi:hypothetical protein
MYRQAARALVGPPLAASGQTLVVTVTHTYSAGLCLAAIPAAHLRCCFEAAF